MFGLLTILILILTIIIATQRPTKEVKKTPNPTHSVTPTPTKTPTPSPKLKNTIFEDHQSIVVTPTPTPTNKPNQQSQTASNFQYPGSTVVSISGDTTIFESSDDPKKITDWYKDKIKSMGMSATSFVQTNTNGNILNKLVGANGKKEVKVEITKQNNQSTVKISVNVSLDN